MKFLHHASFKSLKNRRVRASSQAVLGSVATIPDSGLAVVNNSQGASAALHEFSAAIDSILEHLDFEDDGGFKKQLQVLEKAAGEFPNSSVDFCEGLEEWNCSKETAQTINVAFKCAAAVYDPKTQPHIPETIFCVREYKESSSAGTAKAVAFWDVERYAQQGPMFRGKEELPAMVVAIRGSASHVDHMVNANGQGRDARLLFTDDEIEILRNGSNDSICAHSGFLNSAKALFPSVFQHISQLAKTHGARHVIFTGHSAGGAVASLLFTKFLLGARDAHPPLRFSCITFGSPPVINQNLSTLLTTSERLQHNRGLIIAIANEFDLVPRADQAYIRSLIDLYRSVYGLAPAMDGAIGMESINQSSTYVDSEISSYTLPPLYFEEVTERMKNKTTNRLDNCWKLPLPDYHLIGDIVILRKEDASERVAGEAEAEVKGVDIREKSPRQIVRALSVPQEEFARFLFCGIETHRRIYYNERIDLVARGEFNCRNGWEIE